MNTTKKDGILQVRLDKATHSKLKKYAVDKDSSMTELIRQAIEKMLTTA